LKKKSEIILKTFLKIKLFYSIIIKNYLSIVNISSLHNRPFSYVPKQNHSNSSKLFLLTLKYVLFVASGFVESSVAPAKMIQQLLLKATRRGSRLKQGNVNGHP